MRVLPNISCLVTFSRTFLTEKVNGLHIKGSPSLLNIACTGGGAGRLCGLHLFVVPGRQARGLPKAAIHIGDCQRTVIASYEAAQESIDSGPYVL